MIDQEACMEHDDVSCEICPYYDLTIVVEERRMETRFWVGQRASFSWGRWGDFIALEPRQFE